MHFFGGGYIDIKPPGAGWNKAFDKVDTQALEKALEAFGIQGKNLVAIKNTFMSKFNVYNNRLI